MKTLSDIGEDALIERFTRALANGPEVIAGVGDDCAVIESDQPNTWRLFKVDSVVEGIHFSPELAAELAGRKAVCRTLSDFAGMGGGTPKIALINFAAPPEYSVDRAEGFYRGIREMMARYDLSLVGGETVSVEAGAAAMISVFLSGEIERRSCRFRSRARAGDSIAVTGKLGGSLASGHHHKFFPRIEEARFLAGSEGVHAMMDISDGLAKDLPRLAKASGTGYRIEFDRIPLNEGCNLEDGLADGEDYELLFTIDSSGQAAIEENWRQAFPECPLTVIGEITETIETPLEGGWDHFEKSSA